MSNLLQRVSLVREQVSPAVGHTDSLLKNILSLIDAVVGDVSKLSVKFDSLDNQPRGDVTSRLDALEAKQRSDSARLSAVESGVENACRSLQTVDERIAAAVDDGTQRLRRELLSAIQQESAANRKMHDTLASRLALLEERVLALENKGGSTGADSSSLDALRRDLDTHKAATRQGMSDAKSADDALRSDLETLAARCAEAAAVADLQAEVDAHAATLAALRGLIDEMSGIRQKDGDSNSAGLPHAAIADILAQLNSLRKEKANIGWAKGAIGRLQKDKADRKELRALAEDDGNTTAGAYRCLSCNRNSSGLYKTYPEVSITSNATPPPIPWVGARGTSPPPTSGPSQSNFPRRGTRTAQPASPSAATTPGRIRPSTAASSIRASSVGASRTFTAPADSSAKERYYAYQQWVENLPSQGAAVGDTAAASPMSSRTGGPSPYTRPVPEYAADESGQPVGMDGIPTRRGVDYLTYAKPHPAHEAKNHMHIGTDGRSYPHVESPELAAMRGRPHTPSGPRPPIPSNDLLEARGDIAAGVSAGAARMAVGRQ